MILPITCGSLNPAPDELPLPGLIGPDSAKHLANATGTEQVKPPCHLLRRDGVRELQAFAERAQVHGFANVSIDIPIFEYILAARAKQGA